MGCGVNSVLHFHNTGGFQIFIFIFENSSFFLVLSFHLRLIFITYVSSTILENTQIFENTASAVPKRQSFQNRT